MRVLILGGTTEASELARLMAGDDRFKATLSLAGRTSSPRPQPLPIRVGGFGGVTGLLRFLVGQEIEAVIDATHPYAAQISANVLAACGESRVPLLSVVRPPWQAEPTDRWQPVPSTQAAVAALGATRRSVFVSVGRQDLPLFALAPQHRYVARLIERPAEARLPPDLVLLHQRGPFDRTAERDLLQREKIEVLVSKNSGGSATYPKIEAARALGLPVIMIARPAKPAGEIVTGATDALHWLAHRATPSSERGV
jgi:precorrin-6A/cobalt-precorrin-6A reductase